MKDVNRVTLMGRLGGEPVLRETKSGIAVAHFSVATKVWAPSAEDKERTEWHRITVWGKHGQVCAQHLTQGQRVYIEGEIRSNKYETADGVKHDSYEIHAETVNFLDKARGRAAREVPVQSEVHNMDSLSSGEVPSPIH